MTSESKDAGGEVTITPVLPPSLAKFDRASQSAQANPDAEYGPFLPTVAISLLLLSIALAGLIRLAAVSDRPNDGFLAILVGALIGWPAGMYFSPYSTTEKSSFVSISQAVSAFVSGYLLSKLDRFLETTLFSGESPVHATWTLLCFFAVSFLIFALGTYTCRRYFAPVEPVKTPAAEKINSNILAARQSPGEKDMTIESGV